MSRSRVSPYTTSSSDVTPKSRFSKAPPHAAPVSSDNGEVVSVLREITSTLNTLVKRVESTESGLKKVQDKLQQSCSSRSSSGESFKPKDDVPLVIRVSYLTVRVFLLFMCTFLVNCQAPYHEAYNSTSHLADTCSLYVCGTLKECNYSHTMLKRMITCSSVITLRNLRTAPWLRSLLCEALHCVHILLV